MSSTLFDKSQIVDDAPNTKRKAARRKEEPAAPAAVSVFDDPTGYLLSIDSVTCDRCGSPVDLIDFRKDSGKVRWLVTCGWWCGHSWTIDPIQGLLDEEDEKQDEFVITFGRITGTFREIKESGNGWYIDLLSKMSDRTTVKTAALDWLEKNRA